MGQGRREMFLHDCTHAHIAGSLMQRDKIVRNFKKEIELAMRLRHAY